MIRQKEIRMAELNRELLLKIYPMTGFAQYVESEKMNFPSSKA
jgi:hypothetical protein